MKNVLTLLLVLVMTAMSGCALFNSAVTDPALQDWAALKLLRGVLESNPPEPEDAQVIADYLERAADITGAADTLLALDAEVLALISQMPPEDQMLITDFWNRIKTEDLADINDEKFKVIKKRITYIFVCAKNIYLEYTEVQI